MRGRGDRGAAAVEFAIILPVLITIVMGIMDFGFAFFVQSTAAGAAREGVREFAINNNAGAARNTATGLMPGGVPGVSAAVAPASCTAGATATLTVSWTQQSLTGFFSGLLNGPASYQARMRCGG